MSGLEGLKGSYAEAVQRLGIERQGRVADMAEAKARCGKVVFSGDPWSGGRQCTRKAGHGPGGKFCRQHGEADTTTSPIAVWYRTQNQYGFKIDAVEVFHISDKTLLVRKEFASRDVKERVNKVTAYYHYWPTWEAAVEHLRNRLESERKSLAESERLFRIAASSPPKPPKPPKSSVPPESLRLK